MKPKFNQSEDAQAIKRAHDAQSRNIQTEIPGSRRHSPRGTTAIWQARLALFVMINIAQMWILAATVEAALAGQYKELLPLVVASGVCWIIALTIFLWWKPASRRYTSTGYLRDTKR